MSHSQQLEEKQRMMEDKMAAGTQDMNRITEDYLKQKAVLKENDAVLDSLKRENERLKMQVSLYQVPFAANQRGIYKNS